MTIMAYALTIFAADDFPEKWVSAGGVVTVVGMFIWYIIQERKATKELIDSFKEERKLRDEAHAAQIKELAEGFRNDVREMNTKFNAIMTDTIDIMREVSSALVETRHETRANTEATAELRRTMEAFRMDLSRKADRESKADVNLPPKP